jgi:hypothetical protein
MAPAIPIITLVASLAATAYSAYAQNQASSFQAAIAKRNAEAAERAARDAAARGLNEGVKLSLAAGQARGAVRAGFGASGVELTSGSPLDVLSDAAMFTELDKQTLRSNAEREAAGFRVQSGNYLAQGSAARAEGRNAAFGTVLGGTSSAFGNYYGSKH